MANYFPNIDFQITDTTGSIVGQLDVESATDFPLALTYSVKDVQDPASSKGSFSKTFTLPATANNNRVLKSLYSDSLYNSFQYVEDKDVQIWIDGMLVLSGKFQVQGTKYKGIPQSYDCVVFGDNYGWVNALSELNMCDVNFAAADLFPNAPVNAVFGRQAMMDTWEYNLAGEEIDGVQTHIVYPLVNTGKWTYGDFVAPADMSPAFYVYNLVKVIFGEQGYTLESEFFESNWFKRIVSLLPKQEFVNQDSVIESYSFEYEKGTSTDYKTPLDYANTSGTVGDCSGSGNLSFTGVIKDQSLVCPACDPEGLITSQTLSNVKFDIETPMNLPAAFSNDNETVAGWWWGRYGFETNGVTQAYRAPLLLTDYCNGGNTYIGMDYGCIVCLDGTNPPSGTYSNTLTADVFQTDYLGTYSFNGRLEIEMDKDYTLNNPVENYDPIGGYGGSGFGTFEGGSELLCYGSQTFQGTTETEMNGTTYVANAFLVHYKNETGNYHLIPVASQKIINEDYNSPPNQAGWFCNFDPLDTNLTFYLNYENVQLDILSPDDKVFVYCEVTEQRHRFEDVTYAASNQVLELIQMKYRVKNSKWSGNVTSALVEGGTIALKNLLPCDISQMDWINGLTGMFNLMWQSNELEKKITVEPRDKFFLDATYARNWTEKLHKGDTESSRYIYDALKRNLCFTYENDGSDGFVEERNRRVGQKCELGSHLMNLGELYENEDQQIGTEFYAPTYMFYDKTISNNMGAYKQPFIPVIHPEYSDIWNQQNPFDLPDKVEDFAPRILVWYGKQPLNQADGLTNNNHWFWGFDENTSDPEKLTYYPFAGVYCDQDGDIGGAVSLGGVTYNFPSLYFNKSSINAVVPMPATGYEQTNGLYEMFWQRNILSMLERPKIKTAFFKLTPEDIAKLDFRRLIFIESEQADTYWILNKVIDYKGSKNELTQVELFEYHNGTPDLDLFPVKDKGFGLNETDISTDFNAVQVSQGNYTGSKGKQLGLNPNVFKSTPTVGVQNNMLAYKQKHAFSKTYTSDGTRIPLNSNLKNSQNVGNNKSLNVGSISIGNEQNVNVPNQIVIGQGNNRLGNQSIQFTLNDRTAATVTNDGIFREGGGGCVYYEDTATGRIMEVVTGIPKVDIIANTTTYYYTHVVKGNEDKTN